MYASLGLNELMAALGDKAKINVKDMPINSYELLNIQTWSFRMFLEQGQLHKRYLSHQPLNLDMCTLSCYHHQINSMNQQPLFRVRSWNNGMCCMPCYILIENNLQKHYDYVIMGANASQITSLTIVYSIVYSGADQSKHQSSASLAFVRGIHGGRWIPRTKGQLRGKCFHLMTSSWFHPICQWPRS